MKVLTAVTALTALTAGGTAEAVGQDVEPPPAGYGTLKQDDLSIKFETAALQIRVLPLDERVIRLLAPDTYDGLQALKALKQAAVDSAAQRLAIRDPSLFVVTFFGRQARSEFQPDDITIISRNQFFRPLAILPLTPGWSEQRLGQRQTATAVYVFEPGIYVLEPMQVSYAGITARDWDDQRLRILDEERSVVLVRAARVNEDR